MIEIEKFCVWQTFRDGSRERVREWVSAEEAVTAATHYTRSVGARLGTTVEVMIVNRGDMCVFHWIYGEGLVFPKLGGEEDQAASDSD